MRHLSLYENYDVSAWQEDAEGLSREFKFDDYRDAVNFVYEIVMLADEMDHHPKIVWDYLSVQIITKSHDVDSVTRRDRELASAIDAL
jgi:4a-hydroxytetrahydrobiopterin dehydratase